MAGAQAVDDLPPDEREVVRLQHLEGLTHAEVAEPLGVPPGTVKSRSFRAHQRLAVALSALREGRSVNRTAGTVVLVSARPIGPWHRRDPRRVTADAMPSDDDRIAVLAGRPLDALDVDELAEIES